MPTPNQIVLSFSVSTAGTLFTPAQAAAKLAAVALYSDARTDPLLGQLFGLTVSSDVTTPGNDSATRTLTLNMTSNVGAPFAPPPFVTTAFATPAKIVALYSSSAEDRDAINFGPLVTPGPGAHSVSLSYYDSTGAGPFTVVTSLMGRFPSPISLADHSVDVAIVTDLHVVATGGFGNSIGQITLCELSSVPPPIPTEQDPSAGLQPFFASQDAAQLLIRRALVYLPPSYFALAEQGAATAPAAPPSTDALAIPVGQVVGTSGTAIPPPPPPNPAVLSGTFAQTLSLALAAPVTSAPITFL